MADTFSHKPVFSFLLAVKAWILSSIPPGIWPRSSAACGSNDTSWMLPTAILCRFCRFSALTCVSLEKKVLFREWDSCNLVDSLSLPCEDVDQLCVCPEDGMISRILRHVVDAGSRRLYYILGADAVHGSRGVWARLQRKIKDDTSKINKIAQKLKKRRSAEVTCTSA